MTSTAPSVDTTVVNNGANSTDDIRAYSNYLADLTLTADVVSISIGPDGHGQLHPADGMTWMGLP